MFFHDFTLFYLYFILILMYFFLSIQHGKNDFCKNKF
ncbi:teichoic acid D-Ala incorporation-associated protein DltX [Campylobacter coli]|nr:teichoic acid D-Ala incorporation-associated protein DltX [Campylobacter coli]